ncbi:leucoanthocyanidin reductase-like [Humulus lupulus]|uniref:Leucoanthocyanidin reductase n=1 Tax=Humulus lupulus TaxID=3486 RepID=G9C076_HUMLU|nr:leucoanthocyanidin reductase-like [Humulus lupulus]AEV89964.1 leucoanthocyanidin reductase [Humulus lupulus]
MTVSPCVTISTAKNNGRVLIVGATGFIGHFVAEASLLLGRPTYVLLRPGSAYNPAKAATLRALQDKGAMIVHGLINEKESMEKILKEHEIEIVISAVGGKNIMDQLILLEAIKRAGTVKRFLPSEFGHDVDRADPVEPGLTMYEEKRKVRRMVEESGVPYTYICCNSIASWPYYDNTHPSEVLPPLDKFQIYGDGTVKAYFVAGTDIGRLTMRTVDDVQAINKNVHFRPSCNLYNINELASLWEKKIGKTLPRVTITEDDLLTAAAENCIPESIVASFTHDIFIKGCQINFSIDGPNDVEVETLYPEETFRTIDECFSDFLLKLEDKKAADEAVSAKTHVLEPIPIAASCG